MALASGRATWISKGRAPCQHLSRGAMAGGARGVARHAPAGCLALAWLGARASLPRHAAVAGAERPATGAHLHHLQLQLRSSSSSSSTSTSTSTTTSSYPTSTTTSSASTSRPTCYGRPRRTPARSSARRPPYSWSRWPCMRSCSRRCTTCYTHSRFEHWSYS